MFRLAEPDESWSYPITVQVPAGGGHTVAQVFTARFRLAPAAAEQAVQKGGLNADKEFVTAVLVDWENIADDGGRPLEFSTSALDTLLQIPYWRTAVIHAYFRFAAGLPAKNSPEPSPTG